MSNEFLRSLSENRAMLDCLVIFVLASVSSYVIHQLRGVTWRTFLGNTVLLVSIGIPLVWNGMEKSSPILWLRFFGLALLVWEFRKARSRQQLVTGDQNKN